ncbi:MAG: type II CAAX endopeptidase family protein [Candidatus Micrarchaeota archaeon]
MANAQEALQALAIPLFLLFFPFVYLKLKKFKFPRVLEYLFINGRDFSPPLGFGRTLANSFILLIGMLALTAVESLILAQLGLLDLDKVGVVIRRQSSFVLMVAVLLSPVAEEVFFRGFLQRTFGPLISAAAFGLSHALYGSVSELVGAFTLGLLLSFYVRERKSIAAPIFGHMLYNVLAVLSFSYS